MIVEILRLVKANRPTIGENNMITMDSCRFDTSEILFVDLRRENKVVILMTYLLHASIRCHNPH